MAQEKKAFLEQCLCLIYTPSGEHFGIVPIEAMYLGKVVLYS
jgi:alpha-1,3/alpha-1,6-mannosyltransferase